MSNYRIFSYTTHNDTGNHNRCILCAQEIGTSKAILIITTPNDSIETIAAFHFHDECADRLTLLLNGLTRKSGG